MNTDQHRADFEAWYASRHETYDTTFIYYTPENRYQRPSVDESWSAYQAGRAALQSMPKANDMMLSGVLRMPFDMAMADEPSVLLASLETIIHATTDWLKCEKKIGLNTDQAIHIVCKVIWALLAVKGIV